MLRFFGRIDSTPVSPPRDGSRDELFSDEDWMDTVPPEHHIGLQDIAHIPTSVSDEDEDCSDTSVSSHVEMPLLALNSEVVFENEQTVGVRGISLTVCNSQFRSGASDVTLLSEGMVWLCLLYSSDVKTGETGAMSITGVGSYGSLVSWDNSVYTFVMIASV